MPAIEPCLGVGESTSSMLRTGGGVAVRECLDFERGLDGLLRSRAARTSLFSSSSKASRLMGARDLDGGRSIRPKMGWESDGRGGGRNQAEEGETEAKSATYNGPLDLARAQGKN